MMAMTHVAQFVSIQSFVRLLGLGIFLVFLASCAAIPERTTSPVPGQTSARIIETLQERESRILTLKGLFHAEIDGKGMPFAQSLHGSIFYHRPDHYRIKGFTRFGGLVFDFILSGQLYALRVQDQAQPVIGEMDNFQRLGELRLPVLLSVRAVEVLLGKLLPRDKGLVAVEQGEDFYQFTISPDPGSSTPTLIQHILVNQELLQVRQLEYVDPRGEAVVSIHTSDFRPVRGPTSVESTESDPMLMPFTVRVEDHVEAGKITLEFQEIIANEKLDQRLFTLTGF